MKNRLVYFLSRLLLVGLGVGMALLPLEWYMRQTVRFHPPLTECDDITGYRLIPGRVITDRNPGEFEVTYRINEQSLRADATFARPKPADTWRVLGLGDSFTFGMGVDDEETYLAQLADRLQMAYPSTPIEVINSGVSGWGNSNQLIYLEEIGLAYQPDLITVGFFVGNDAGENQSSAIYRLDAAGTLERTPSADRPELCQTEANSLIQRIPFYRTLANHSATMAWLRGQYAAQAPPPPPPDESEEADETFDAEAFYASDYYRLTYAILAQIDAVGAAQDIPVVFLMIPIRWHPQANPAIVREYLTPWLTICEGEGLHCLDMTPLLLDSGYTVQELYYQQRDAHWQPLAHRLAADALFEYLQAEGLIDLD